MAKSKFFRVAVEGATVDGRTIERDWIEQMAATYDPATYTATINCEHIAGYSPDRPFNSYGKVLSLKAMEVELSIGSEKKKLLALYAEVEANDQLLEINKAGQKLFTSCEINPDFAGTGKAYLVGLAVTDNPASLGTEPLKFAAMSRPNVFTSACETAIELHAEPLDSAAIGESIGRSLLSFFRKEKKEEPATPPAQPANDNAFDVQAFTKTLGESIGAQIAAAAKPANDAVEALNARFDTLETQLAGTEQPQGFTRSLATGGGGDASFLTDC